MVPWWWMPGTRTGTRGAGDPVDPRPGHIRGAVNVPCRGHLDPNGRLAGSQRLRENFSTAGIESAEGLISYCGSGVTACHNLLVLEHLGLGGGRLFVGGGLVPVRLCAGPSSRDGIS